MLNINEEIIEKIDMILSNRRELGLIYIDTGPIRSIESIIGWEIFDSIVESIDRYIREHKNLFHNWKLVIYWKGLGDNFVLLIESLQGEVILENIEFLCLHIQNELAYVIKNTQRYLPVHPVIQVGYSVLRGNANIKLGRLIWGAIEEAQKTASTFAQRDYNFQIQKLRKIIEDKRVYMVFQPIVELCTGECIGYEALARGPKGSAFEAPEVMFSIATKAGIVFQLEDLCKRKLANQYCNQINKYIFVNIEPSILESRAYKKLSLFLNPTLYKSKIVIEITERMVSKDYNNMDSNLRELRGLGYKIAIDDVGSSYLSLESLICLRPDFVKIGYALIKGIKKDFIKQEIVKTLVDISRKVGAKTIAEGIESNDDLEYLRMTKVDYGQGFYISVPADYPSEININLKPWTQSGLINNSQSDDYLIE